MTNRQNYIARMELNKKNKLAAGLVSDLFPGISGMIINMTYYYKGENPVLMERTINVLPAGYAYFNMECMIKDCFDGGFDLTSVIAGMVKGRKKSGKGSLACKGKNETFDTGHASISYVITIQYNGKSK